MIVTSVNLCNSMPQVNEPNNSKSSESFLNSLKEEINKNPTILTESNAKSRLSEEDVVADEDIKDKIEIDVLSHLAVFLNFTPNNVEVIEEVNFDIQNLKLQIEETIIKEEPLAPILTKTMGNIDDDKIGEDIFKSADYTRKTADNDGYRINFSYDFKKTLDSFSKTPLDDDMELLDNNSFRTAEESIVDKIGNGEYKKIENDEPPVSNNIVVNSFINKSIIKEFAVEELTKVNVLPEENIQKIKETIVELIDITTEGQETVMNVKLYPEDLGTVDVILKMDKGKLSTKIIVESSHLKQLFADRVKEISENLIKQNVIVENFDIEVNTSSYLDFNSQFNSNDSFNNNGGREFKHNNFKDSNDEQINHTKVNRNLDLSEISIFA